MQSFLYQLCSNFCRKLMRKQSMRYSWKCWVTTSNGANTCGYGWLGIGRCCNLETVQFLSPDTLKHFKIYFTRLNLNFVSCSLEAINRERKLFLVSLYFLIWGEAANVRFLPECICYIFHHVSLFSPPLMLLNLYYLLCALIGYNTKIQKDFISAW